MVSHQTATIQQTCEIGILIKDGRCIDTFDIKADRITLLGSAGGGRGMSRGGGEDMSAGGHAPGPEAASEPLTDDDIPF